MKISVVIPVYNEAENIKTTITEINGAFKSLDRKVDHEFVIVDDYSTDNITGALSAVKDARVHYIRLSKRSGAHIALRAGFANASGDAVLFMAADGEDDPACLGQMLEKWAGGAHVVWALRKSRDKENFFIRRSAELFYKLLYWFVDAGAPHISLEKADFFLVDRTVVNAMSSFKERNTSFFGLLTWVGFRHDSVEYDRRLRRAGKTKWTFRKKMRLAKDWIIGFSGMPLKIMTGFGFCFASFGFLYGFFLILNAIFGKPLYGWSSLMVAILVIGGIQMIMLGVIGEYLWRNLEESRNRPLYFVEREENKIN